MKGTRALLLPFKSAISMHIRHLKDVIHEEHLKDVFRQPRALRTLPVNTIPQLQCVFVFSGRIHSAVVSGVNNDAKTVTVEWFERGETKGKEVRRHPPPPSRRWELRSANRRGRLVRRQPRVVVTLLRLALEAHTKRSAFIISILSLFTNLINLVINDHKYLGILPDVTPMPYCLCHISVIKSFDISCCCHCISLRPFPIPPMCCPRPVYPVLIAAARGRFVRGVPTPPPPPHAAASRLPHARMPPGRV